MSFEITNDSRSERFRDVVSRAFAEILGHELQYGPWTVMLRSERELLRVVITGPDETRQEWAFHLTGAHRTTELADQLRQRFRTGNGRPKTL